MSSCYRWGDEQKKNQSQEKCFTVYMADPNPIHQQWQDGNKKYFGDESYLFEWQLPGKRKGE